VLSLAILLIVCASTGDSFPPPWLPVATNFDGGWAQNRAQSGGEPQRPVIRVTLRGDSLRRRPRRKRSRCHSEAILLSGKLTTPCSGRTAPGPSTEVQPCVPGPGRKKSKKLSWITTRNDLSWRHESQDRETNT